MELSSRVFFVASRSDLHWIPLCLLLIRSTCWMLGGSLSSFFTDELVFPLPRGLCSSSLLTVRFGFVFLISRDDDSRLPRFWNPPFASVLHITLSTSCQIFFQMCEAFGFVPIHSFLWTFFSSLDLASAM